MEKEILMNTATQMNIEDLVAMELSQIQKNKHVFFILLRHLEIVNFMGYKQNNSFQEWRSKEEIRS